MLWMRTFAGTVVSTEYKLRTCGDQGWVNISADNPESNLAMLMGLSPRDWLAANEHRT